MCSDCEAYRLKKHGLTRSDYVVLSIYRLALGKVLHFLKFDKPLGQVA